MAAVARARGGIGAWLWRDSKPSDALAASAIRRPGRRITLGDTPAIIRIPPQDQLTARRGPRPPWSGRSACHAGIRTGMLRRTSARTPTWQPGYPLGLVAPRCPNLTGRRRSARRRWRVRGDPRRSIAGAESRASSVRCFDRAIPGSTDVVRWAVPPPCRPEHSAQSRPAIRGSAIRFRAAHPRFVQSRALALRARARWAEAARQAWARLAEAAPQSWAPRVGAAWATRRTPRERLWAGLGR